LISSLTFTLQIKVFTFIDPIPIPLCLWYAQPSNIFNSLFLWFKVHKYKLHFICGVNERVSGPEYNMNIGYNPGNPLKYYHSHINFLATCQDPQSVHAPAKLFFAECGNYSPDESWCLPLNLDQDTGMHALLSTLQFPC